MLPRSDPLFVLATPARWRPHSAAVRSPVTGVFRCSRRWRPAVGSDPLGVGIFGGCTASGQLGEHRLQDLLRQSTCMRWPWDTRGLERSRGEAILAVRVAAYALDHEGQGRPSRWSWGFVPLTVLEDQHQFILGCHLQVAWRRCGRGRSAGGGVPGAVCRLHTSLA